MATQLRPSSQDSERTVVRFALRLTVLMLFAAMSPQGFARTLLAYLIFATLFCLLVAATRRERALAPDLGHWDEAVAYTAIGALVLRFA